MSTNPNNQSIRKDFSNIDLAKPLDPAFLRSLSLDEVIQLKKNLIERAAAVIGEIAALKETDELTKSQFLKGFFNSRIEDDAGVVLFKYTCDQHLIKNNHFTAGYWFQEHLELLRQLQELKAANLENYPVRKKESLIRQLLGSKPAAAHA